MTAKRWRKECTEGGEESIQREGMGKEARLYEGKGKVRRRFELKGSEGKGTKYFTHECKKEWNGLKIS